jgi:peptidoglycan/xylan/chitin deacetylase (PgdA/CDA1 family)
VRPVVLTFDDGRASDYDAAFPLLATAGVRAEFFLNTGTIGSAGFLTWSQVAEMQRAGHGFQSHSHDHVVLRGLSRRRLEEQLGESKARLEDHLGARVEFLAPPYGLLDRRVVEVARDVGYRAVCGSWPWPAKVGAGIVNRIAVYRGTAGRHFDAVLAGRPAACVPAAVRAAIVDVPKKALLKMKPAALGVRLLEERA